MSADENMLLERGESVNLLTFKNFFLFALFFLPFFCSQPLCLEFNEQSVISCS